MSSSLLLNLPNRELRRLFWGGVDGAVLQQFHADPNGSFNGAFDVGADQGGEGGAGEEFEMVQINDFTSEEIKSELSDYHESSPRSLAAVDVCPARHGGPLDYPKVASR